MGQADFRLILLFDSLLVRNLFTHLFSLCSGCCGCRFLFGVKILRYSPFLDSEP